jgi:hypothetical protein
LLCVLKIFTDSGLRVANSRFSNTRAAPDGRGNILMQGPCLKGLICQRYRY